jgi:DNA repair protein RecO (recombination protein O)
MQPVNSPQKENEKLYRTDALIIKMNEVGEADKILTLYTPSRGKLRAIAKGVRRTSSRLSGNVQLFTQTRLLIAAGRNLDIVTQSQPLNFFKELQNNHSRLLHAYYVLELLDKLTEEANPNHLMYELTVECLEALDKGINPDTIVRTYELKLLDLAGYRPQLQKCVRCEQAILPGKNFFSTELGGVICPECSKIERNCVEISVDALKALRYLQKQGSLKAPALRLSPELRREVELTLRGFTRYILERDLRSAEFIHNLS